MSSPHPPDDAGIDKARIELALTPQGGDPKDLGIESGVHLWNACSSDPAFVATVPPGAAPLAAGWYSVRAVLDGRSGDIDEPVAIQSSKR